MNSYDSPCKNCEERRLGCHDCCERYNDWKKLKKEVDKFLEPTRSYVLETVWQKKTGGFRKKKIRVGDK